MWIINHNKKAHIESKNGTELHYRDREDQILFMDLRRKGVPFEKKYLQFTQEEIAEFASTYHNWQLEGYEKSYQNIPEYCYSASREEIESKGYSLVPSKYIEFVNKDEEVNFEEKMQEIQSEMKDILLKEESSRKELKALFNDLGFSLE